MSVFRKTKSLVKSKDNENKVSSMVEKPGIADRIVDVMVIILCGLVAFCCVIPIWHVLMSSLSDGKLLYGHEGMVWWPLGKINLDGYKHIFADSSVIRGYFNTIVYTVSATALGFLLSVTAGYALSRETKLRKFMTVFVMTTMLFGGGLVPTFMVIKALGWVGTPLAIIIPGCTNAMFIIMMMNAFNSVPKEMYEAARIDGAGHFRTLFQIMLPQAMNLGTVIILNSVVGQWNSWMQASIYVANQKEYWPLQLIVREIVANSENFLMTSNPDYSRYLISYAVIIAASLPIIVVFPFFQEKMEKGVITGGIKG